MNLKNIPIGKESIRNKALIFFNGLLWALLLFWISGSASASVLISEVLPNPIGSESGGEFVELYNPTDYEINISGFAIATSTSERDAVLPEGAVIKAHGFYLIADIGWASLKDNASWVNADYEEAITISNTDSGIALRNGNNTLDALGYGNSSKIKANLSEGKPFMNVAEGHSIERKPGLMSENAGNGFDSNDNSADFIERESPMPQNSLSSPEESGIGRGKDIMLSINVAESALIKSAAVDDEDYSTSGIQILPNPGLVKEIYLRVNTSAPASVNASLNSSKKQMIALPENYIHEGIFQIDYFEPAGFYRIEVRACSDKCESSYLDFYYMPMLSLSIDAESIDFGTAAAGENSEILGDFNFGTKDRATLWNTGNTMINLKIAGSDFLGNSSSIPASSIRYSFDNDFSGVLSGELSYTAREIPIGLSPSALSSLGFRASLPGSIESGEYIGMVSIEAVE